MKGETMITTFLNMANLFKLKRHAFNNHDSFILKIREKYSEQIQRREDSKKDILQEIIRLQSIVKEIDEKIKLDKKSAKLISDEFDYKYKAKSLLFKTKSNIDFNIDDTGTFWVYGNYNDDDINDPFHDEHYCDTWREVYERVNVYYNHLKDEAVA